MQPVSFFDAREFVRRWHYAKGMHNGPTATFGLFDGRHLVGVCAFATPVSEAVRGSVFGAEYRRRVTELHRLVLLDEIPGNAESHFISRAIKQLKVERPDLWAILSYCDEGYGHVGTVYQASNAFWCGSSPPTSAYIDPTGRLRHRRQCGRNVSREEAAERGWREVKTGRKHRYLLLAPDDRKHRAHLLGEMKIAPQLPYPKFGYNRGSQSGGMNLKEKLS